MGSHGSRWMLAILIVAGVAVSLLLRGANSPGQVIDKPQLVATILDDPAAPVGGAAQGDLTLAVYTDYRCTVCRAEEAAMQRAIARDGRVRVIYKELPILGAPSRDAAVAALAAQRQGLYAPVRRTLMAAPRIDRPALQGAVAAAGGRWPEIAELLENPDPAVEAVFARSAREALQLGIAGTPAYLAGPVLVRGGVGGEKEFARLFAEARRAQGN